MSIFFSHMHTGPIVDMGFGGEDFVRLSPQPSCALVGLVIKAGAWIDRITPIFAELRDDGIGDELMGEHIGGHGGYMRRMLRCSPGCVAVGIQTRSGNYVDAVRLLEAPWDGSRTGTPRWTDWVGGEHGGGAERTPFITAVDQGEVIIGLAGRAAGYIDALTCVVASCDKVVSSSLSYDGSTRRRSSTQPTG